MFYVDSFRISSIVDIIQELFQVKEVLMEHLNNSNIIACIQNSTEILKSKDILLLVQHLNSVKGLVTIIIGAAVDIEMQSIYYKESFLLDHVQIEYH